MTPVFTSFIGRAVSAAKHKLINFSSNSREDFFINCTKTWAFNTVRQSMTNPDVYGKAR